MLAGILLQRLFFFNNMQTIQVTKKSSEITKNTICTLAPHLYYMKMTSFFSYFYDTPP